MNLSRLLELLDEYENPLMAAVVLTLEEREEDA